MTVAPFSAASPFLGRVIVGCDHAGFALKQALIEALRARGVRIEDVGGYDASPVDYPDVGARVARQVAEAAASESPDPAIGVLCCGSGVGMGIAANRFAGVRAVVAQDVTIARLSRQHNDANVLCLGGRITAIPLAIEILDVFLTTPFDGARHAERVAGLDRLSSEPAPPSEPSSCGIS